MKSLNRRIFTNRVKYVLICLLVSRKIYKQSIFLGLERERTISKDTLEQKKNCLKILRTVSKNQKTTLHGQRCDVSVYEKKNNTLYKFVLVVICFSILYTDYMCVKYKRVRK